MLGLARAKAQRPLRRATRGSLQVFLTGSVATLALLALVAATSLVVLTTWLGHVAFDLRAAVESVRVCDELHVALLTHNRLANLDLIEGEPEHQQERGELERVINGSLADIQRFATTDEERTAVTTVTQRVARYLDARRTAASPGLDTIEAMTIAVPHLDAAVASVRALKDANVQQARTLQDQAATWDDVANKVGLVVAAALLAGVALILALLRARVFRPLVSISHAIGRYGETGGRAPEVGPDELRNIARTFNDLVTHLERRAESRLVFLAGVAHDLRTPLSAMKVGLATIRPDRPLPDEKRLHHTVSVVTRQVDRIERMVTDLLDAARIEAGQLSLRLQERDVRELVRNVVDLYQLDADSPRLQVRVPSTPLLVRCDPTRIEQVVTNLVSNALKYSPEGGQVDVVAERQDGHAVIAVRDQGIGIAAEDMARIFEPFRRASALREDIPGVGLGLSVVRNIVRAHGGALEVDSTPGRGSEFRVELPLS